MENDFNTTRRLNILHLNQLLYNVLTNKLDIDFSNVNPTVDWIAGYSHVTRIDHTVYRVGDPEYTLPQLAEDYQLEHI